MYTKRWGNTTTERIQVNDAFQNQIIEMYYRVTRYDEGLEWCNIERICLF